MTSLDLYNWMLAFPRASTIADVGIRREMHSRIAWHNWMGLNMVSILICRINYSLIWLTELFVFHPKALSFSAGVAGVAAIVQTLKQDDHVIYVQITNGDSDWLFRNKWKDFGIQVQFIYSSARESILQVIRENTKVGKVVTVTHKERLGHRLIIHFIARH